MEFSVSLVLHKSVGPSHLAYFGKQPYCSFGDWLLTSPCFLVLITVTSLNAALYRSTENGDLPGDVAGVEDIGNMIY